MINRPSTRKRGVQLAPEGLQLVSQTVVQKWQALGGRGKLTREARAEILGVSIATAERLLAGRAVDRATVTLTFRNLSIAWEERYLVPEPSPAMPVEVVEIPRVSRRILVAGIGVGIVLAAVAGVSWFLMARQAALRNWDYDCNALLVEGNSLYHQGRFKEAADDVNQAISMARAHDAAASLSTSLRLAGDLAAAHGSFAEAKEHYQQALSLRQAMRQDACKPPILEAIGTLDTELGEYGEAQRNLTESLASYDAFKDPVGVAMAERDLGTVAFDQGRTAVADSWFHSSLRDVSGLGKPDIETDVKGRIALVLLNERRVDEARETLRSCLQYWTARRHPRWIALTEYQLGTVEAAAHHFGVARRLLAQSESGFRTVGDAAGVKKSEDWLVAKVGSAGAG